MFSFFPHAVIKGNFSFFSVDLAPNSVKNTVVLYTKNDNLRDLFKKCTLLAMVTIGETVLLYSKSKVKLYEDERVIF